MYSIIKLLIVTLQSFPIMPMKIIYHLFFVLSFLFSIQAKFATASPIYTVENLAVKGYGENATIARNMAIDYFRKKKRMPTVTNSDGEDVFRKIKIAVDNREEQIIRTEKEDMVRAVINKLPEEQRQVLILRHYGDLSFKEISEMTNVSINTALGRMRYALNNMRKMMEHTSINAM